MGIEMIELEEAAAGGATNALIELGMFYSTTGEDGPDYVTAHKWFNLAAVRGDVEARERRTELAREMSQSEIAEAQRRAREWLSAH